MQNEVNVELSVSNIPKSSDKAYGLMISGIENTESRISNKLDSNPAYYMPNKSYDVNLLMNQLHTMTNILNSGSPSYSSQSPVFVGDVNFDVYKDVSKLCKSLDMSVTVSKYGLHIESCDDPASPEYYNCIQTNYTNGDYVSQVISHREEDGSFYPDDVVITLTGDECKSCLSDIKSEVAARLSVLHKDKQQQTEDDKEQVVDRVFGVDIETEKDTEENEESFNLDIC